MDISLSFKSCVGERRFTEKRNKYTSWMYSTPNERTNKKYRILKEDKISGNDEERVHKGGGIWAGH